MSRAEMIDRACRWLANRLPRRLVYFAAIRVAVHATTGRYSSQVTPELTVVDALKRWEGANV